MKQSATSAISWPQTAADLARLDPAPASAEQEAIALLRIAAEVEGALLAQYLFSAGSLLPGISVTVPGFDHPIQSDDWYDAIRMIAKQEMGHLITVQNLLLSLGATPHLDRENFPSRSPLYPFPFSLQPVRLSTIARYVCAEAPREVAPADKADLVDAAHVANIGDQVPRAGQLYERLYYLLQDGEAPQDPWRNVVNPFPHWPSWHVEPGKIGLNQDRQATAVEWRGQGSEEPPDTAVYALSVQDKSSARTAVYTVGLQGEGPIGGDGVTHFDKFLRIFRELRAVGGQPGTPAFVRNQADDPRTGSAGNATISHPATLLWAKLCNVRYRMLLMDIALSLSVGTTGQVAATSANRVDFIGWAFREMLVATKPLAEELRQMPLSEAGNGAMAGFPFELPEQPLPTDVSAQIAEIVANLADSRQLRAQISGTLHPTPKQQGILRMLENLDTSISRKIAAT